MKMNRIAFMLTVILAIYVIIPSQYVWTEAKAEQTDKIIDGIYQVELSFLSLAAVEHEDVFSQTATLTVHEGQYTLSVPIKHEDLKSIETIKVQDESIPFELDRTENLVQVDVKSILKAIVIDGTIQSETEEMISFSQKLTVVPTSLPPIEKLTPPIIEPVEEVSLNYVLWTEDVDEPSMMNTYVDPVINISEKNDTYYADMKIVKSSWVTKLTVETHSEFKEPETISLKDNIRKIRFEVTDLEKIIRMSVKVHIPEIEYEHQYVVRLKFDERQVASYLGKKIIEKEIESIDEITPEEIEMPKQPSVIEKPIKEQQKIVKKPILPPKETPTATEVVKNALSEALLSFDRTLDKEIEEEPIKQLVEQDTKKIDEANAEVQQTEEKIAQLDKMKVALLVIVLALSAILFIRRIKGKEKDRPE